MHALIVGSGPVGMTVAGLLSQQRHRVTLIDKRKSLSTLPRGIAVNQATLAVFDRLGIGKQLDQLSLHVPRIILYRDSTPIGRVDFRHLDIERPFFCHVTQNTLERTLLEQVSRMNIAVHRGITLDSFTDAADGIQASCIDADGRTHVFNADVLLACDGGNSTVRSLLGLQVDQQTYGAYFLLADVRFAELPLSTGETHYFLCRAGYLMVVPIPGGCHRVILSFKGPHRQTSIDGPSLEWVIAQRAGIAVRIGEVCWTTQSSFGHRVSRGARCHNAYLAGDALHQFSPIGGTNMNVGIEDAVALAEAICKRRTDEYEAKRLDAVARHLRLTQYLTRVLVRTREMDFARRPFASRAMRCLLEDEIPRLLTGLHGRGRDAETARQSSATNGVSS
jgi:2-polyprenyl-6-methoxyphenol hydroxylase-like FAD-dependent oxidoreductase